MIGLFVAFDVKYIVVHCAGSHGARVEISYLKQVCIM